MFVVLILLLSAEVKWDGEIMEWLIMEWERDVTYTCTWFWVHMLWVHNSPAAV